MPIVVTADANVVEYRDGQYIREFSPETARRLAETLTLWADWAAALAIAQAAGPTAADGATTTPVAEMAQKVDPVKEQAAQLRKDGWKWYPSHHDRGHGFWGKYDGRFRKSITGALAEATAEIYAREFAAPKPAAVAA